MSDESNQDVSPLRLKRPGAAAPKTSAPVPPVVPSPVPVGEVAPAAEQANATRRRPTLATLEEPGAPVNFESSASETPPVETPSPPAPVKLRVGVKSMAHFPLPGTPAPSPASDLFPPVAGAPLLPLPGMPEMPWPQSTPGELTGGLPPTAPPLLPLRTDSSSMLNMELGGSARPIDAVLSSGIPPVTGNGLPFPSSGFPLAPSSVLQGTKPEGFIVPLLGQEKPEKPDVSKFKRKSTLKDHLIYACAILFLVGSGASLYFYILYPDETRSLFSGTKAKFEKTVHLPAAVQAVTNSSIEVAKTMLSQRKEAQAAPLNEVTSNSEQAAPPAKEAAAGVVATNLGSVPPSEEKTDFTDSPNILYSNVSTVTPAAKEVPPPSRRFLRYAEALVVSGVFHGEPVRALVDGRIVRGGDLIEPMLSVTFVGVDESAKQLILEERSGAQVRVKY